MNTNAPTVEQAMTEVTSLEDLQAVAAQREVWNTVYRLAARKIPLDAYSQHVYPARAPLEERPDQTGNVRGCPHGVVRRNCGTTTPRQGERGDHSRALACVDAGRPPESDDIAGGEPRDPAVLVQQLVSELDRTHSGTTRPEHEGEQFGVGQRVRSERDESLARALVGG